MMGSENFFDSIKNSFKRLLVNMAAEWAASQIVRAIFGSGAGGFSSDAKKGRDAMFQGAAAVAAAGVSFAASTAAAAAAMSAAGAMSMAGGPLGAAGAAASGLGTAGAAGGASKLLGGASKFLGYAGIGLAADQMLFGGAISKTIVGGVKKVAKGIGHLFGFANGGRPSLDRPSIVGEDGLELFIPARKGTVASNGQSRSMLSGIGGGVNFNGAVTINDAADVARIQAIARAKTQQKLRLA